MNFCKTRHCPACGMTARLDGTCINRACSESPLYWYKNLHLEARYAARRAVWLQEYIETAEK